MADGACFLLRAIIATGSQIHFRAGRRPLSGPPLRAGRSLQPAAKPAATKPDSRRPAETTTFPPGPVLHGLPDLPFLASPTDDRPILPGVFFGARLCAVRS
eukprot:9116701-Heterocapsa_arctica.AAC.1